MLVTSPSSMAVFKGLSVPMANHGCELEFLITNVLPNIYDNSHLVGGCANVRKLVTLEP